MSNGAEHVVPLGDLRSLLGQTVGTSRWELIDQARVNQFADATGDHQWIHVDPERAAAGPFGTTIVHGYLLLSLAPMLLWQVIHVEGASQVINYGLDKVRFPTPVAVGSRVRAAVELREVREVEGGLHVAWGLEFQLENAAKPACVAQILFRYYR